MTEFFTEGMFNDLTFPSGAFNDLTHALVNNTSVLGLKQGVVKSIETTLYAPYPTIGVQIGAEVTENPDGTFSPVILTGIKCLNTFMPYVGKTVWLLDLGTEYIGLGDLTPAWQSYTPAISGWTKNVNGTVTGNFIQIGKTVHFKGIYTIGSTDVVGATSLIISLPLESKDTNWNGVGRCNLTGASFPSATPLIIAPSSTTGMVPQVLNQSSTFIGRVGITSSNYTRVTGETIIFSGTYETI